MAVTPEQAQALALASARRKRAEAAGVPATVTAPQAGGKPSGFWPTFNAISQQVAGAGENVAQFGTGMVATPIAEGAAAAQEALSRTPGGGNETAAKIANALTFQPRTETGKAISDVTRSVTEPVSGFVNWGAKGFPSSPETDTSSPFGEHLIKSLLGVAGLKGVGELATRPASALRPKAEPAPTIEALKAQSKAAYDAAENTGSIATSEGIGKVVADSERTLAEEGFRPKLHPATADALEAMYEDGTRPDVAGHTMKGIEGLRRVVSNAERAAANADDARLAGQMLDKLDDYIDTLAPQFKEGRALWSRVRKAQDIEALFERAENAAGGYTQAGFETALRNQFRRLADNPKRFNRFSTEEQTAILKVVRGGPAQSIARWAGKLAPRGVVSASAAYLLGGGPAGAVLLGGAGESARALATGMRTNSARAVSDLVRRGPQAPQISPSAIPEVPTPFTISPSLGLAAGRMQRPPAPTLEELRRREQARQLQP